MKEGINGYKNKINIFLNLFTALHYSVMPTESNFFTQLFCAMQRLSILNTGIKTQP